MNTLKTSVALPADSLADADLVSLTLSGDDLAFARIMRRYNRLLFRIARSILKNDDDTQDALQEAYLHAWRALASFRSEARLSTWLVRIVVNEALGRLRRQGVRPAQVVPLNAAMDADGETLEMQMAANTDDQPEPSVMRAQVRQQIEARIDTLPDAFRTVFMLKGLPLGIPEATVRSRFFRARGILREGLSRDIDMAIGDAFSFAGQRCDSLVDCVLARIVHERESSRP